MSYPYDVDRDGLLQLLVSRHFPEWSQQEDAIILAWIQARGKEYDRWSFSVRVGQGQTPDPSHLESVQRGTLFSSRKRIDILCWLGQQPFIGEVKYRLVPAALGQLQTYRHLWMEDNPGAKRPRLFALACYSDPDTIRVHQANGVDVFLYPDADVSRRAPANGAGAVNGDATLG